jgi:ABC-2 type transport system ATP-binding protein
MKLEIANLSKSYGEKEVLKSINFTFEEGKIYGLLGRNGAGKTTLFNAINNDISIDKGKFYLDSEFGKNILNTNDIGYVISTPVVPEFLTGREFLQFYLDINEDKKDSLHDIDYYFDLVKLTKEDQNLLLRDYSHGMKNKIQLLITIISNPKIILLDEPLTSLDIVVQEDMKQLLKSLKENHIIIFSTHILELATDLCDEIVILSNKNLELITKENLNTKKYKDKIIKSLKEEKNV